MQHNPYCIMKHQESCEVGDDSATCQSEDGSGKHSGMGRSQSFETTQKQFVNRDFPKYGMQICHTFSHMYNHIHPPGNSA